MKPTQKTRKADPDAQASTRGTAKASAAARTKPAGAPARAGSDGTPSHRKFYVLVALVGVMTLTSALLMAIQPAPLVPESSRSLYATDKPNALDVVFETKTPLAGGRWKYLFIHHSQTPRGNASTLAEAAGSAGGAAVGAAEGGLADHFVIGNGDGCADGEIQVGQRWNQQLPAGPTADVDRMDPTCISICLIGDFDHTYPTPTQMKSLGLLVDALQRKLRIDHEHVWVVDAKDSPAGVGRYFPRAAFRGQLLP